MTAIVNSLTKLDEVLIYQNEEIGLGVSPLGRLPVLNKMNASIREPMQGIPDSRTGVQSH